MIKEIKIGKIYTDGEGLFKTVGWVGEGTAKNQYVAFWPVEPYMAYYKHTMYKTLRVRRPRKSGKILTVKSLDWFAENMYEPEGSVITSILVETA